MDIKSRRESRNMTQEELGQIMNVSRTTVAMWESGAALPRTDKIPILAEALGCEIKDLFE